MSSDRRGLQYWQLIVFLAIAANLFAAVILMFLDKLGAPVVVTGLVILFIMICAIAYVLSWVHER